MTDSTQPIGIFDSGVGGLTVLRKLANLLPNEQLVYLGDTARVPYGNKSPETIGLYARQCTQFLLQQSVKLIVVACNTVSAVALDVVKELSPVPVIGMISPAARAALHATRIGKIGIIGTYATVNSHAYDREIYSMDGTESCEVFSQACPLFVPLAEEGWHYHPATYLIVKEYLTPLQKAGIDTLILGCTHYPLLAGVIQELLPDIRLIDSGEESAHIAQTVLQEQQNTSHQIPLDRQIDCYVTDKPTTFTTVAERFLGFPLSNIRQIPIEELSLFHQN